MNIRGMREKDAWRQYTAYRRLVFTADLVDNGFPRNCLADETAMGRWVRVCPGGYRRDGVTLTYEERVEIVARKHPKAVFCLETVLWESVTLLPWEPEQVWIALPKGARPVDDDALGLRCVWMAPAWLAESVSEEKVGGRRVRMFSLPKTAVDCFKYRERVGITRAVDALRFCLRTGTPREELIRLGALGRVEEIVRSHIASWQRGDWVDDPDDPDAPQHALRLSHTDPLAPGRKRGRPPNRREEKVERRVGPPLNDD